MSNRLQVAGRPSLFAFRVATDVLHSSSFRAMGTDIFVELETHFDPGEALLVAREVFELQESRFSRFRPGSLLSRFNKGEVIEDEAFVEVLTVAVEAHSTTRGLFNPMVLPALVDAGYSVTFEEIHGGNPTEQAVPAPGDAIELRGRSVRLRYGALDLGGIVKGWTVDLCTGLLSQFSPSVVVNAGGDLRVVGDPGDQSFGIACPRCDEMAWMGPVPHALATSTRCRRHWLTDSGQAAHHIIDPRDGLPARSAFLQVSVFAPTAAEAEIWSKAILIGGGEYADLARAQGLAVEAIARCVHRES